MPTLDHIEEASKYCGQCKQQNKQYLEHITTMNSLLSKCSNELKRLQLENKQLKSKNSELESRIHNDIKPMPSFDYV